MKNHFISVPLRYYFKNKSELFWIFTLLLLKKLPIFSPMPLSCRCSHHIPTRITNFKFSRIFSKTESFGKTNQTKIHNLFFMKRCGDQQNLQKICNPCPAIVRLSLNFTPDNLFIREWILNFEFWKNKSNENSYFIFNERCGDQQNLQKNNCNPCPPIVHQSLNSTQTICPFRGYSLLLFLSIFIGNLLCCSNLL